METMASITGPRKAAILLMAMGEEFTTNVFKHLEEEDIKIVGKHMAQINKIDPNLLSSVMDEFTDGVRGTTLLGGSGENFLSRTVSKAFDSRKADNLLDDVLERRGTQSFERLSSLSPQALANVLINEHPQTIALIPSRVFSGVQHST